MRQKKISQDQSVLSASVLRFFLFTLIMLITCIPNVMSQVSNESIVNGRVTDKNNEPIIASVVEKGTGRGVTTDENGEFKLQVSNLDVILIISSTGYESREVFLGGKTNISISLDLVDSQMDEVVVVAYGTQKKETITGAISSIHTKEIKQSPAANLAVSLAGRLPGLTAIQRSGQPGRDVTQLYIRGQGTVNTQSPIVLVDGVERELTYIDPNEIATVTILKDASATAIFGVRGANGVILVTTRRGDQEVPAVSLLAETGMQSFPRFIQPVNAYEFATLRNLALMNDGLPTAYSEDAIERYRLQDDPKRYPNTNWEKLLMKKYALQQRYNLNISGATKNVNYFVNAGYLKQAGQFNTEKDLNYDPSFNLDRFNFRSNIDIRINKSLKALLNVAGYLEKRNNPYALGEDDPMRWIIYFLNRLPANVPGPLTDEGEVITSGDVDHPAYGLINRSGYIQQTTSNVLATFGMEQNLDFITKGLSIKAIMSFDSRSVNNFMANRDYEKYIQIIDPNLKGADGKDSVYFRPFNNDQNTPLNITGIRNFATQTNAQAFINYNRSIGRHTMSGLVLYQRQTRMIDQELPYKLEGSAVRLTYGFDSRYFLEFNGGYNGSEQFAKKNRFGFFPAVSGSWVIKNEKFLKDVNSISSLKIRGSYGKVGNDRIGDRRFLYLDDIQVVGGGFSGSLDAGRQIVTSLLKNEHLQWEVARKTNVGIEVGFLNSIFIEVDWFNEKRNNILRNRGIIPILNGYPNDVLPPVNIGVVHNKGYEIQLGYQKAINKDLQIFARLNLNHARNKQIFADEPELPESYAYRFRETGYPIGQFFGYVVDGYFQDQADIDNSPEQSVGGHESRPGDFKYKDLNNDGKINERDIAPIGYSRVPEYQYGAAMNINYKQFDISVLFQGVSNVSNYFSEQGIFATNGVANYVDRHLYSWTEEKFSKGEEIRYPRLTTQSNPNENLNSFFIINTSYLRLKNAEIGYTIPSKVSSKIFIKSCRIYVNGLNLITWDKMPIKDVDPEMRRTQAYPLPRIYNVGVNVTF